MRKYSNNGTNLFCYIDKEGDSATTGWINLFVYQGSLNLVHDECGRGVDRKAQAF